MTSGVPGCLVLDVRMPLMTGLELQNEMLRRGLMLPTIFLTGHADIDVAVSSLKRGAVDFLIKPVNDEILLESIAAAVIVIFCAVRVSPAEKACVKG